MSRGWIGVDLDGTLAEYDGWTDAEHIGEPIPLTNVKDFRMIELWDDRCITVEKNTGRVLTVDPRSRVHEVRG